MSEPDEEIDDRLHGAGAILVNEGICGACVRSTERDERNVPLGEEGESRIVRQRPNDHETVDPSSSDLLQVRLLVIVRARRKEDADSEGVEL